MSDDRLVLAEEEITVDKAVIDQARIRIETLVETEEVLVRDELLRDFVDVERVAIGVETETAPEAREEDGVLIIPIIEERLVIRKQLWLVEELRVHRRSAQVPVEIPATRRVMRAVVEREQLNNRED